jgi:hypothetical protein
MERKEYLLSELPIELWPHYDAMDFAVPVASMGFTAGGVRYRIYRDERAKATAKAMAIDLTDALKGADVAAKEIEAAMDALGYDTEERRQAWAEIAAKKRGNENGTD